MQCRQAAGIHTTHTLSCIVLLNRNCFVDSIYMYMYMHV